MRIVFFIVLLFLSCGRPPDLTSRYGVDYFFDGAGRWTQEDVDDNESEFLRNITELPKYSNVKGVLEVVENAEVFVEDGPIFPCEYPPGTPRPEGCGGLQDGRRLRVRDWGCATNSPVAHEVLHLLQMELYREIDYLHEEQDSWGVVNTYRRRICPVAK